METVLCLHDGRESRSISSVIAIEEGFTTDR